MDETRTTAFMGARILSVAQMAVEMHLQKLRRPQTSLDRLQDEKARIGGTDRQCTDDTISAAAGLK